MTLDVQVESQVSVSGPPEEGQDPKRVESFAKGQIVADVKELAPSLPKEAELAIQVIGAPYLGDGSTWGGKGYDCCARQFVPPDKLKTTGYCYYDGRINRCSMDKATGVDCSGLIFWAYNRAYYGDQVLTGQDLRNLPVLYEGAGGQYRYNTERISKEELKAGDLLFFEGHVAMYTGPFSYEGEEYNVVHASGFTWTITAASYEPDTEELTTIRPTGQRQILKVKDYGRVTQPRKEGEIIAKSPVDLAVKDPDGLIIERQIREVPGMEYQVYDRNADGELDDIVIIGERKIGDYLILVAPESGARTTDTYTLELTVGEQTIVLAEDVQIKNIPARPYIVRSTQTEIIPIIPATIDFDPDTLNLKGKGKWVTAYIELPMAHGYDVSMIELASITLNDQVEVEAKPIEIGDYDGDGIPDLMVKFDRQELTEILHPGEQAITLAGCLADRRLFAGTDVIRVIH